jgi:hypothetical protein
LFGEEGQHKLRQTSVAVAGVGGLGSPFVQHLALLGIGRISLIDSDELDETSRNRFIGARHNDPVPGSIKVLLAGRLIREINPQVDVVEIPKTLISVESFNAIKESDWSIGCFDDDGPRFVLNEICAAYAKPYIDLASDVPEPTAYGGRVFTAWNGRGCLNCLGLLDSDAVSRYLSSDEERARRDAIYGVRKDVLREAGPSVSTINGVIAALAATEFMVGVTGMRDPTRWLEYRGQISKVIVNTDNPTTTCYYCQGIRGKPDTADVDRYLRIPHLCGK